jgi:carboxyl-terminal processing protease
MPALNESQRRQVFQKVVETTASMFADPRMNGVDWKRISSEAESAVLGTPDPQEFETKINELLLKLGTSHIGFFHGERPRSPGRIAISATFLKAETSDGPRWMFQDVHPGGLAANAGMQPGDVLLRLNGIEIVPPASATFSLATDHEAVIRRPNGSTQTVKLSVPASQSKKRPLIVPDKVVTSRKLDRGIGYVRVSMFPGMLGIDVARDITQAVADLECKQLVIDLRGNTGGGIGCLRLMSVLCADKRGAGYNLGRPQIEQRAAKEALPVFDKIPASKWGVLPLILKFGLAGRSVAVFSEGLGQAKHHGRAAILINEHSASASEMVAAFASEYKLAHLVGVKTPGKLVAASSFKVGHGYRVALPVGAYYTWQGTKLEGRGVAPDTVQEMPPEALAAGEDPQLARAIEILC